MKDALNQRYIMISQDPRQLKPTKPKRSQQLQQCKLTQGQMHQRSYLVNEGFALKSSQQHPGTDFAPSPWLNKGAMYCLKANCQSESHEGQEMSGLGSFAGAGTNTCQLRQA